ncbi:ligand-binding sensor domain-containing protein [Algoriphagus terrigena]|uniref:ligand-binding sensor domain-containing protein n=1 Tax=Algoriphagus terrigena TaxID=344884 RepID=UPI000418E392|nr:two-component regulator propeller domain-containing protein [Algoriphagus terrigena]
MKVFSNLPFSKIKKLYILVFALAAVLTLPGSVVLGQRIEKKPDLKFQRIFEGLLNNRVSGVYQDKLGFIWVGTYSGLHKYDGLKFRPYTNSADSSSINNNYIGAFYEDSHDQLWIGTGNGVALYNRDTDDFTRFRLPTDFKQPVGESNLVNTILEDSRGTLWVSSVGSGLFYLDRDRQEFLSYGLDANIVINGMAYGDGDILWLATFQHGLVKLNTATSKTEYFQHDPTDSQSISSNHVKTVAVDRDGNLWAGTRSNGLNRMTTQQGKVSFVRYAHDPADEHSLYNNAIYKLYVDPTGNLWTCNENGGLHLYDKEMDAFYRYLHDPKNPTSLTLNSVWNIFQDNQSRYWVGTAQSGIDLADPYASKFSHYFNNPTNPESLNNDIVRDFLEAKNGNIWVATDGGGLNYFNREKGTFKSYRNNPGDPRSLRSDAVISLNEDSEGKLWVGTWNGGLNILADEHKGTFISFQEWIKDDTYPIRNVFDVHFDEDYVWIAAFDEGLYRYDKRRNELRLFKSDKNESDGISSNLTLRIFEDSRKNLWIGTHAGVNVIRAEDKVEGKFKVYQLSESNPNSIPSNSIRQIFEDRNQNIWIATDKGLSRYMPEEDNFITYDQEDGLPVNEITSIVEDDLGFLWIGSIRGISKFDPVGQTFKNFGKADGLQGNEFSRYSVLKTRKGELLFGGLNGFNLFDPAHLTSNLHAPQVYLTDLKLFNKSVDFKSPGTPLQKHISATDTLRLSHRENVFSFDFIGLNYSNPEQNQYAYFLEGFDEDWNYVGTQRNATYTNLNPGTYVFRVKASNSDGVWNETGTSLVLVISPPFWKTAWFITLVSFVVVSLLIIVYKLQVRAMNQRNKQLENKVKERTTMLQHANADLKKHIDDKDKLLCIIGHDLRNPFFSIIGYMELLEDEFKNTDNSEHLENIQYLLNVSRNTHNLLENLLQWAIKETTIFEVKPQMIQMSQIVKAAVDMVSSQADYKKITLKKSCSEEIFIHADRNMILTVLRNLISNAIKFSDENSRIEISVSEKSGDVITSVRDYGTGMREAVLSKLFSESNTQAPGTMGEVGTGLGLVLCQEIVQKHEGKIWAQSTLGKGSTFNFSLSKYESAEVAV